MKRARVLLLLAVLALPVGSCGGGGGGNDSNNGGGLDNSTFSGTYVLAQFSALRSFEVPAAESTSATWGRVVADGAGMVTATVGENENGVISPPSLQPAAAYSVAADGTFTVPSSTGGITADGNAGVLMTNVAGQDPEMGCVLRTSGVYSNLSFNGSYHLGQIGANVGTRASLWSTTAQGAVVADGMGSLTYPTLTVNEGGTVSTSTGGTIGYAVTADGTLTSESLIGPFQGGLVPDGSFVIGAGGTTAGKAAALLVMIKYSVAATPALFSGSYWIVSIDSNSGSNGDWTSFVGTVTADGAGVLNLTSATSNEEGVISTRNGPEAYAVAANGTLTAGFRVGAISADGRYAFLCGDTAGNSSALLIFIRK